MTPTLVDIARETRTSVSTVSRVLSGGAMANRISRETRDRVREVAERLGYRETGPAPYKGKTVTVFERTRSA